MGILRQREKVQLEGGGDTAYPWYSPKFWHGMGAITWLLLLTENRASVSPSRLRILFTVSLVCGFNSGGRLITDWLYRRKIRSTKPPTDPIFIIGHWRSGTTLLHELMMLDKRFTTPNTYQCFAPGHFLITEPFFQRFGGWLLPNRRPFDNVKAGWDRPQEDEFALMNLGAPSPYRRIAFPLTSSVKPEALDITKLNQQDLAHWKREMRSFMTRLRIKDRRRQVLKSPTHTARIKILLEMFPDAKFIYISRTPYAIFPSTRRLWQALHATQSLQQKPDPRTDSYILACFQEIQTAFDRDKSSIPDDQVCLIRYEDLVKSPVSCMRRVYEDLDLGNFAPMERALQAQAHEMKGYQTNIYKVGPELDSFISSEFRKYIEDNGYETTLPNRQYQQ